MKNKLINKNEKDVETLINQADILINNTITKINYELINMYWELGKIIFDYKIENNSKYGDAVIGQFREKLGLRYGKGFSRANVNFAVQFYKTFQKVSPARQFKNILWSHYREILVLNDIKKIDYYLKETEHHNLTKLELRESIKSKSFERTIIYQKDGNIKKNIEHTLKDPVILKIKDKKRTEKELENEIVVNIFTFMKEIGDNISFFGRQYKIINHGLIYKVDLVLYDKKNRNFILIDLKINKIAQKDISQMRFYIDYFNNEKKDMLDSNTIGLILCETKDLRMLNNDDIYQIRYLNEIPKEKELLKIINENKIILLKTEVLKLNNDIEDYIQ